MPTESIDRPEDILVLEENTQGEDFLISDLHGSHDLLTLTLLELNKNDRLFIAGDLADRGPDSLRIFDTLIKNNSARAAKKLPPQIYAIKGNHEDIFLAYCNATKKSNMAYDNLLFLEDQKKQMAQALEVNKNHPLASEVLQFLVKDIDKDYAAATAAYDKAEENFEGRHDHLIQVGGTWVTDLNNERLLVIEKFITSLPSIIHVGGAYPFNVVHADLPCSNQELQTRIAEKKLFLTKKERFYAHWAREDNNTIPLNPRNENLTDTITYCGHSVCGGVRKQNNHINIDVGSYLYDSICLIGHKNMLCKILGAQEDSEFTSSAISPPIHVKHQIEDFLKLRLVFAEIDKSTHHLKTLLEKKLKENFSDYNINEVITAYKDTHSEIYQLIQQQDELKKIFNVYFYLNLLKEIFDQKIPSKEIIQAVETNLLANKDSIANNSLIDLKSLSHCFRDENPTFLNESASSKITPKLTSARLFTFFKDLELHEQKNTPKEEKTTETEKVIEIKLAISPKI